MSYCFIAKVQGSEIKDKFFLAEVGKDFVLVPSMGVSRQLYGNCTIASGKYRPLLPPSLLSSAHSKLRPHLQPKSTLAVGHSRSALKRTITDRRRVGEESSSRM